MKTKAPDPREVRIAELTADLQRTRADFENFRKQIDQQRTAAAHGARTETVAKLLPVVDAMKLAVQHHQELEPVAKTIDKALAELGVAEVVAAPGTVFDPALHDAVKMDEAEGSTEVVAELLRPGYALDGEVLRPAMVTVTKT
jgi:molecular chaperone GrpE